MPVELPRGQRLTQDQPGTIGARAQEAQIYQGGDIGQALSRVGGAVAEAGSVYRAARLQSMDINVTDAAQEALLEMMQVREKEGATTKLDAIGDETSDPTVDPENFTARNNNALQRFESSATEITDRVSKKYKLNDEEALLLRTKLATYRNGSRQELAAHVQQQKLVYRIDQAQRGINLSIEMYAAAGPDPSADATRAEALKQGMVAAQTYANNVATNPEQRKQIANEVYTSFLSQAVSKSLERTAMSTLGNAEGVLQDLKDGKYDGQFKKQTITDSEGKVREIDTKAETIKTVESIIEGHRKEDAYRKQEYTREVMLLVARGEATDAQIKELPYFSDVQKTKEIQQGQLSKSERYATSRRETRANLIVDLYTKPESITELRLRNLIGASGNNWISTNDYEWFLEQAKERMNADNSGKSKPAVYNTILGLIKKRYENGEWGKPGTDDAELEFAKRVEQFDAWVKNSPDGKASEFYERSLGDISNFDVFEWWNPFDWFGFHQGTREGISKREGRIPLALAGMTVDKMDILAKKAESKIGTFDSWLAKNMDKYSGDIDIEIIQRDYLLEYLKSGGTLE